MPADPPRLTPVDSAETVNDCRARMNQSGRYPWLAGGDVPVADWIALKIAEVRAMPDPPPAPASLFDGPENPA